MKQLYIIKLGETHHSTAAELGDFEDWVENGLGVAVTTVDPRNGDDLPPPTTVAGAVLTGSHAMVTERLPWSERTGEWLVDLVKQEIPVLGICYGHHLLAHAHGATVDYHPQGMEIGTVDVELAPEAADDALFKALPPVFPAQTVHSQTVRRLPEGAVLLAGNTFEQNHAFRLGPCAWGVQFHPEFSKVSSIAYIRALASKLREEGRDPQQLEEAITETPEAASVLSRFARIVAERDA